MGIPKIIIGDKLYTKSKNVKYKRNCNFCNEFYFGWGREYCSKSCRAKDQPKDKQSPFWKGNEVGYSALHEWVIKKLGQPSKCKHCNQDDLSGREIHWANKSKEYKRDLDDWIRLCVPCHKKYDALPCRPT